MSKPRRTRVSLVLLDSLGSQGSEGFAALPWLMARCRPQTAGGDGGSGAGRCWAMMLDGAASPAVVSILLGRETHAQASPGREGRQVVRCKRVLGSWAQLWWVCNLLRPGAKWKMTEVDDSPTDAHIPGRGFIKRLSPLLLRLLRYEGIICILINAQSLCEFKFLRSAGEGRRATLAGWLAGWLLACLPLTQQAIHSWRYLMPQ